MLVEHWREILYPLGFLSSIAFGGRVLLQWMQSEIKKESVVTKGFWQLSMTGNLIGDLHAIIQMQFHVCLVQSCNAIISWRNINIMKPHHAKLKTVFFLFALAIAGSISIFALQGVLFTSGNIEWFRIPINLWTDIQQA